MGEAVTANHLADQCAELRRALRESEARRRLIEDRAQAVWETDAAGSVVTDSPSWRTYTGQTLQEWLGSGWLNAIHPEDRTYVEQQWREAVARRGLVNAEFRLRTPDGDWRWTNVRATAVCDEDGNVVKWVGMNIDVDANRRAEASLGDSERNYRTLFDAIDEGFAELDFITDDEGNVVDWRYIRLNPAFTRLTGLSDVSGRLISDIVPNLEPIWAERYTQVLNSGEPLRFEEYAASQDMWLDVFVTLVGGPGTRRAVQLYNNITTRKKAEAALRQSETRLAVLLDLTDALRPLTDPLEILGHATRILGEYMQADRTFIAMMESDGINLDVHHEYLRPGASSVIGHHNFDSFGAFVSPHLVDGHVMAVEDIATLPLAQAERAHYAAVGIAAYLLVPLVRDGRFAACFTCNHQTPRAWTDADKNIVRQVADRTWAAMEHARAAAALRASEERFSQFAIAASAGIWMRDAATLTMEYVSPAILSIYGVEPYRVLDGAERWAAMVVPEDRGEALLHLEQARRGESVVHEFRVQRPSDGTFRWIRDTAFPLEQDGHVRRIGGFAEDVTETKLAVEHQGVLLLELQHRVRNIMAIIRSIVARTAEGATSVADYAELVSGRLLALARVQALLTRSAGAKVGLTGLVRDELGALAASDAQFDVAGPDVELSPKAAETMTLAVHELTTNALKYGALASRDGIVTVRWKVVDRSGTPWLVFRWVEAGAPPQSAPPGPRRVGFGSELIEGRIPYELRGRGAVVIEASGARCDLEFPLRSGASVLETDAPRQATVFGGVIDMSGQPDLSGQRVLVMEDDYYIATDTARALRGAGAEVIGPCATEDDARDALADAVATCAVVDINLGTGPSFEMARKLRTDGVPVVFITGYDQEVIPADLADVQRLQKPVQFRAIVAALASVLRLQS